ncbi:MAG TPA: TIGR03118 family protein [Solirubrobacteraceae bacterium]|nr:TIGR03118 family protein [Solirubrobacteraceae bacterium]
MPHRSLRWLGILAAAAALAVTGAALAGAHGGPPNVYTQRNLVSDISGVARTTDRNLVNPWGLAFGPTTPAWVADNGKDLSTLYSGAVRGSIPTKVPLEVSIPGGAPTGVVFNTSTTGFKVGANPARFIFDSEAGTITAWNGGTAAQTMASTPDAIYKGLAIADSGGKTFLYAANFHAGTIDVFDDTFAPATLSGDFTDPNLPMGFAPFNIQEIGGKLYVAYAQQDANAEDEVAGAGLGFVDVYDTSGHLLHRVISNGALNAPWGLTVAPKQFGAFGGDLLVGNFGDGVINAYNPNNGQFEGALRNADGNVIAIDGLWALRFGNGTIGTTRTLLFTAGIGDEGHGIFGSIEAGRR